MTTAADAIRDVLATLEPMLATDGGTLRLVEFAESESRLTVEYAKGVNEACETCVLDADSLTAFIEEGIRARGVEVADVRLIEPESESLIRS